MIYTIFDISIIKMIVTSNVDVDVEKCVQNQNNYYNIYYNNSTFKEIYNIIDVTLFKSNKVVDNKTSEDLMYDLV